MERGPSAARLFLAFFNLGLRAFGGPAMVNHIKHLASGREKWLDEEELVHGIALCQMLPGAIAVNFASYVGYRLKGLRGMLAAFAGFSLPAFVLILFFSAVYEKTHAVPAVASLFTGLEIIVVGILAHASYSLGRKSLKSILDAAIALLSAAALLLKTGPVIVLAAAALLGVLLYGPDGTVPAAKRALPARSLSRVTLLAALFFISLLCLYIYDKVLFTLAVVMSKVELFAFGGGYTALTLMSHEVIEARSWLDNKAFIDGVAMGQITPGPILITASFIGYLLKGLPGAVIGAVYIFAPGLILITLVLPFFDRLASSPAFKKTIRGIVCCFVGMLGYFSIKFGLGIHWDAARGAFFLASLLLAFRGLDILWLVLAGASVSLFLF